MFQKIKNKLKNFMANKSGFSLVELIVVIAIMAVMAAVLAPALLGYVEKSRMQKDDSAMDEVVNSIQLSLADQSIYDEVLEHSVWDNVSCYIDKKDESQFADCKVQLKAANGDKKEQYMFGDEARLLDETVYYAAGNMRGLTITFSPNESGDTYDFANGILNKFVGRKTGLLSENPELYNRLRSVIGDKLDTTSQTYRNSDYTIFIRVGSTGGSEAVMQDAIQVWGQFNGTNLAEKDHKFELSSGRVVGTAGANDATNNQKQNETNNDEVFSESYISQLTNVTPKTWSGLKRFRGCNVWTDGANTYYSSPEGDSDTSGNYVFKNDNWETVTFNGLTDFFGIYVWTDGKNTYYSAGGDQYVLKENTWEPKVWKGPAPSGDNIWTDGINIYLSAGQIQCVLEGDRWVSKTWNGLESFNGDCIWTDEKNIYYSNYDSEFGPIGNYILNGDTWAPTSWTNTPTTLVGFRVWHANGITYFSYHDEQFVFVNGDWKQKTWSTNISSGYNTWTDGTNYYYSGSSTHYILSH